MKFTIAKLKDAYIIHLEPRRDQRGFFERLFCQKELAKIGLKKAIVQINYTLTLKKGTVRGMHYQNPPFAEGKIVTCLKGEVFDCLVDLRQNSPTFLKWHGEILSEDNKKMIFIPEGFAHGLQTLKKNSQMLYFHTNSYNEGSEKRIKFDDPIIGIKWKLKVTEISAKDKNNPYLRKNFQGIKI